MQQVLAEDESTVRFVLKQPAAFPSAIASGYFGIASPEAVKKADQIRHPHHWLWGLVPSFSKNGVVAIASS